METLRCLYCGKETEIILETEIYPLRGTVEHRGELHEVFYRFISDDTIEFIIDDQKFMSHYKSLTVK